MQGAAADAGDARLHGDFFKEAQGRVVIRLCMHAGVGEAAEDFCRGKRGEGVCLCLLCQTEIIGKVDDTGGIRLVEGYAAGIGEGGHNQTVLLSQAVAAELHAEVAALSIYHGVPPRVLHLCHIDFVPLGIGTDVEDCPAATVRDGEETRAAFE